MSNMWEVQVHHTTVEISSRFLLGTRKSGNGCAHTWVDAVPADLGSLDRGSLSKFANHS